jgi:hypothetical protein
VGIQLGAYKYMLMNILRYDIPLSNMYTYSPISIKSIAGCGKKGSTKADMIDAFIKNGPDCEFRRALIEKPELFQTKKAKNWILLVDDLVDSYWAIHTIIKKENLVLD